MVAEILVVPGSDGEGLRSAAQYVARGLSTIGVKVHDQISMCPDTLRLQQAVASGLNRSNVVVVLGGMGRASGFVAKHVIAQGLKLTLEPNRECLAAIQAYCKKTGEPFDVDDLDLASLPKGAKGFPPSSGKLPGCIISSSKQHIILLPENQAEIAPMFNHHVVPALGGSQASTVTRTLRTYGVREGLVKEKLSDLTASANPMVTVQKEGSEVLVRVTAHSTSGQQAAALCTPVLRTIVDRMGDAAYGLDVQSLQAAVVQKMIRKTLEVGVAEAGLNGMLTRLLGETEGGQEILRYSVAADDNDVKVSKLGAKAKLLRKRGGVSEYAAVAMAAGALEKTDTGGLGIGVTVNIHDEGNRKCPPGTAYIAVCDEEVVYVKKLVVGDGDASADTVIDAVVSRALNMLRLFVDYLPDALPAAVPLDAALRGKRTVTDAGSYEEAAEDGGEDYYEEDEAAAPGGKVRKFILTLAILIFLGSAGYLVKTLWYDSFAAARLAERLQNMYGGVSLEELPEDYPGDYLVEFAALWMENPDVVAFINIPDTGVQYPIVQADDNDYYLRRDFNGKDSQHGVPFLDYRNDIRAPSNNLVIYGHNMKDGQIFGELINYSSLDYYRDHPVVELATLYEENIYKIFGVFITNAYPMAGDDDHFFNYHDAIHFETDRDLLNFAQQVKIRSLINTTVDVMPGDELITLSTCTYEFQDARFVVVARKLRSGETADVNTADAEKNPQPLYPDVWYTIFPGDTRPNVQSAPVVTSPAANSEPESFALNPSLLTSGSSSVPVTSLAAGSSSEEAAAGAFSEDASGSVGDSQSSAGPLVVSASLTAAEQAQLESEAEEAWRRAAEAEQSRLAEESRLASEAAQQAAEAEAARAAAEASQKAAEESSRIEAALLAARGQPSQDFGEADTDTPRTGSSDSSSGSSGTVPPPPAAGGGSSGGSGAYAGAIGAYVNGSYVEMDAEDLVAQVVQNEVGASFQDEAIKAQAVAAYSYMLYEVNQGKTPSVYASSAVSDKVRSLVAEVAGKTVTYGGKLAYTPYHATSSGQTANVRDVWGGSYAYLVSVDSSWESSLSTYKSATVMSADKVEGLLYSKLGIDAQGDPSGWFEVLDYADGGYNGNMAVCGYTTSQKTGSVLTGRLIRETVLNLRSACFTVDYDSSTDSFTFTTYGYGHGVGMPQNGANLLAKEGWNYVQILEHYYPGTIVQ